MMTIAMNHKAQEDDADGAGDYHLNKDNNNEAPQPPPGILQNQGPLFRRGWHCTNKKLVLTAIAVLVVLVTAIVAVAKKRHQKFLEWNYQQCPSEVERWVYYNGAYFYYGLHLHQFNPDPTLLIFHGGYYVDENKQGDPNNLFFMNGCGQGGWKVESTDADGSSFVYEYVVPEDEYERRQQGGAFYMGGVQYDLFSGSVFLKQGNVVTQLTGLDVSSLVIDEETKSVASVTEFCYANQEILDYFDSIRTN
jgi:hypothetical protein